MSEKTIAVELTESELNQIRATYSHIGCCNCIMKNIVKKIDIALEQLNAPQIGDRCAFWDGDKRRYAVSMLMRVHTNCNNDYTYTSENGNVYMNCAPIQQEAVF